MPYKLVMLGNRCVGRSAQTLRFLLNRFEAEYEPTLRNVYRGQVMVDGERCQLAIVDITGREEFQDIREDCMDWGHGFFFVYAVDSIRTFVDVSLFWDQLRKVKGTSRVPMVLVANKVDLAHCLVDSAVGQEAAKSFGVPFVETSAKSQQGVVNAFQELVREIQWSRIPKIQWPLVQEPQEHQDLLQEAQDLPNLEQDQGCTLEECITF